MRNAPEQIAELVKWGVNFDRKENGEFGTGEITHVDAGFSTIVPGMEE